LFARGGKGVGENWSITPHFQQIHCAHCVKQEKEIACCGVDETYFGRETANHCVLKSIGSPEIVSDDCIAGRVCYCYPNVPPSSALEVCPYNKGIYDGGGGGWESGENKTCSLVEG
jgi:hypothetical protein